MMKKTIWLPIFLMVVLLVTARPLTAIYCANDIVPAFPDGDKGAIEHYVIEGAGAYFKAQADVMNLFSLGETGALGPFDFPAALSLVRSAEEQLQKAKSSFLQAYDRGKSAGYAESKLNLLKDFDYDAFALREGLNEAIMKRVEAYLAKGDITGFYAHMAGDIGGMIESLTEIRGQLEVNLKPKTSAMWQLLQQFSETTLFGNYGTIIGQTLFNQ
jgi:hypothetical protein